MLKRLPRRLYDNIRERKNRRVHWSGLQERGASWGLNAMIWIYKRLGPRIFKWLLSPVIGYFFLVAGTPRRESQKYLKKVHAAGSVHPGMAKSPTLISTFYHFRTFGEAAFDRIASWFGDIKRADIDFDNDREFIALAQSGTGGVIIGSHLGNIELCRALADDIDTVKMNILVFTEHAVKFNAMLEKINSRVNHRLIHVSRIGPDTAIMLKEKIDQGELIVILGDRTAVNSKGRLNYINFLGEDAPFSQGPFILTSLLECPVYLLFCLKEGQRYRVYFEHFADNIKLNRKSQQQDLHKVIGRFAERLEYYCLKEPFQWFNFFDFWDKQQRK